MLEKWTSDRALKANRYFFKLFYYGGTIFIMILFLLSKFIDGDFALLGGIIGFPIGIIVMLGWIVTFLIYLYKKLHKR